MNITPVSLMTCSVDEIIKGVAEAVFEHTPEEINNDNLAHIEKSLARLSNSYAYVVELLAYSRNHVRKLKRSGYKIEYENMMDKRDALEDIASAVKLQYQSVSRILTVKIQSMTQADLIEYRKENSQW